MARTTTDVPARSSPLEVFAVALRLGLTSFGGPIAHLGYYREEYVVRRRWLDERAYLDLVALCQFLPGPASSQIGIAVGSMRAGWLGGVLAWVGFTGPSALMMLIFAYGVNTFDVSGAGWLRGLMVVAVAVVANAVWGMARTLAVGRVPATIAIAAAVVALALPSPVTQVAVIAAGGVLGWRLLGVPGGVAVVLATTPVHGRRAGVAALVLFAALLVALPLLHRAVDAHAVALVDANYRAGSLVFGGGHVVLPLLQSAVVPTGWLTNDRFMAGYGAAQAVPGPLFSFAAYLGAAEAPAPNGWLGGLLALSAIYLPSFLLLWGVLPFWHQLRALEAFQAALRGIAAAVVGILAAALYSPVWTSAIGAPADFALALICLGLLVVWRLPPWLVVVVAAAGGQAIALG